MKYALLIYEDDRVYGAADDNAARLEIRSRHATFGRDNGSVIVGGAGLKGTTSATTVRSANGTRSVHDGPFAETKEQLGGFYLIDVADLDAAIAIAKKMPLTKDGSIEIRPILVQG